MRTFSRWMQPPPPPQTSRLVQIGCLAALVGATIWLVAHYPWLPLLALALVLLGGYLDGKQRRHLAKLAADRLGENLCTFVRAFPRGERDPWILRAVHEELQPHCATGHGVVPVRPSDGLRTDFHIDDDDLDDMAITVARRVGRDIAMRVEQTRTTGGWIRWQTWSRSCELCRTRSLPNKRMQLPGRCGAYAPMHVGISVAAAEALICVLRAVTARS